MVFGNQTKLNPSISSASHSTLRHQETCKRTSVSQSVKYQHTRVSVNACTAHSAGPPTWGTSTNTIPFCFFLIVLVFARLCVCQWLCCYIPKQPLDSANTDSELHSKHVSGSFCIQKNVLASKLGRLYGDQDSLDISLSLTDFFLTLSSWPSFS